MKSKNSNALTDLFDHSPVVSMDAIAPFTPFSTAIARPSAIAFIDRSVSDAETLIAGLEPGTEVYWLDSTNAISQITKTLLGRSNIGSLHVVSHGQSGGLLLGADWIDSQDLDRYSSQLRSWATALTENADILLYGCNVGAGNAGQAFVQQLAELTSADIAASNNLTGNAALNGDWNLEVTTGSIELPLAFNQAALSQYAQTLNIIINEFQRATGTNGFTTTEYIEFLLTADYTAIQLESLFFGDSNASTSAKAGVYRFNNLSSIASTFKAGTIIVVGGSTPVATDDVVYNPIAGGTDEQWNLRLKVGGSYITGSSGDFSGSQDAAWVGNTNTGNESIHSIAYSSTGSYGPFGIATTIKLNGATLNNVVVYSGDGNQITDSTRFSFVATGSLGLANGGSNTTYINALRNPSAPPTAQASTISFSEDTTYSFKASDFSFVGGILQSVQITQLNTIGQLFLDSDNDNVQDVGEAIALNQIIAVADISKLKFKPVVDASGNNYANFRFKVSNGQFSATDALMTLNVAAVNDAPVLDTSSNPTLPNIFQNATNLQGIRVTDLIASLGGTGISDIDLGALKGIAITGVNNSNGTWQFSTNGGANWTTLNNVSDSTATLLGSTPLYAPTLGSAPDSQNWLSFYNLKSQSGIVSGGSSTQSTNTNGALLNTTATNDNYAGYTNYDLSQNLKNLAFPVLDRTQGFSLSFNLQVLETAQTNNDRGFAVVLLSEDGFGIELGFQFDKINGTGRIFAQSLNGNTFVGAESTVFNTSALTAYTLKIDNNSYRLFANGTEILAGGLRNYSAWTSPDSFPSPYSLPNFVFLGDNTTSARGIFNVGQIAIQTDTRVRFVPNAGFTGTAQFDFRAWDGAYGGSNGQTNVNTTQNGGITAFSSATETASITVQPLSNPNPWVLAATADFDGDNKADLLWRSNTTGELVFWKMDGTNLVNYTTLPYVAGLQWQVQGAADVDGDTKTDLLWRHSTTGESVFWKMDGTTLVNYFSFPSVSNLDWQIQAIADFDGDRKVDLLWRHRTTGENVLWKMDGTTLVNYASFPSVASLNWQVQAAADFDGDGKTDLLWRNTVTGENVLWKMDGSTLVSYASFPSTANLNWQIQEAVDLDGDGQIDLLWRNAITGELVLWKMNGSILNSLIAIAAP